MFQLQYTSDVLQHYIESSVFLLLFSVPFILDIVVFFGCELQENGSDSCKCTVSLEPSCTPPRDVERFNCYFRDAILDLDAPPVVAYVARSNLRTVELIVVVVVLFG